jgi:hypothetical protein
MVVILMTEVESSLNYFGFAGGLMDGDYIILEVFSSWRENWETIDLKKIFSKTLSQCLGRKKLEQRKLIGARINRTIR